MHGNLIRSLQERAARAQPARHGAPVVVEHADGWLLRHAPDSSWWIGSVLPHTTSSTDIADRVDRAEQFYAAHGAVTRFQITPGVCPAGLDALLDARGYVAHAPVSLQVADTALIPPPSPAWDFIVDEYPDPPDPSHVRIRALLDGRVVSEANAVVDTGWTGIFGMATIPAARGNGAARAVLGCLARWAPTDRLYLQVEQENPAARSLYERVGFTEISVYHYRSRKLKPAEGLRDNRNPSKFTDPRKPNVRRSR